MFPLWLLGVLFAVLASVVSNLGLNLQKRNHNNNESDLELAMSRKSEAMAQLGPDAIVESNDITATQSPTRSNSGDDDSDSEFTNDSEIQPSSSWSTLFQQRNPESMQMLSFQRPKASVLPVSESAGNLQSSDSTGPIITASFSGTSSRIENGILVNSDSRLDNSKPSVALWQSQLAQAMSDIERLRSPNYSRQPLWVLGMALVVFGSFFDFAALAFAAQSIIAPLGSVANRFCI